MGCIELNDGITNRSIPVESLPGTVRFELGGSDGPREIIPEIFSVEAVSSQSQPSVCPR